MHSVPSARVQLIVFVSWSWDNLFEGWIEKRWRQRLVYFVNLKDMRDKKIIPPGIPSVQSRRGKKAIQMILVWLNMD